MKIPDHLHPLFAAELNRAWTRVWREIETLGFACPRLGSCQLYLEVFSRSYGCQWFGDRKDGRECGDIVLPSTSSCHWTDYVQGRTKVLPLDILRHEYGHAYADVNRRRIETKRFEKAFGWPHEISYGGCFEYDAEFHITEYAATSTGEDFAEIFWMYLKHRGKLPKRHQTKSIIRKWKFVESLRKY